MASATGSVAASRTDEVAVSVLDECHRSRLLIERSPEGIVQDAEKQGSMIGRRQPFAPAIVRDAFEKKLNKPR